MAMPFIVKQGKPTLIPPAEETQKGLYFLSNLDHTIALTVRTIYCFKEEGKGNETAAEVIKEALSKVLVQYYPLAGRLTTTPEGKLIVDCTGEGAVFVEAEADCEMEVLGDIGNPDPAKVGKLVYNVPGDMKMMEIPPLVAQVTRFTCGGFVLGLGLNHCIVDGICAMEFVNSWAETARGLPLSVPPFLDRSLLRSRLPPSISFPHHEFAEIPDVSDDTSSFYQEEEDLLYRLFSFDSSKIAFLKSKAMADVSSLLFTSFEALSGFVWRARTQALNLAHNQKTKLLIVVNGRAKFNPPLPKGYFGNGIVLTSCVCDAGELVEKPLSFAAGLVKQAVRMVTDEYMRSAIDYFETTRAPPSMATALTITTWSRLEFYGSDFGWGSPVQVGPATTLGKEVVIFLPDDKELRKMKMLLGLPRSDMVKFQEIMDMEDI